MAAAFYDALVIGGGPGGSTAATFLVRNKKRVLLLEKERFPRFHIGESLLPYNRTVFEELGVLPELEAAGFPVKMGAQFHLGNGDKCLKLQFRNGRFTRHTTAFQVERAKFDHILLQHAARSGVEVREEWAAANFSRTGELISVQAKNCAGKAETFQARFLIDATGRANLTGNQENLRVIHPNHKKVAVFGHFHGVVLDKESLAADTVIIRLENKWFWIIPITERKTSVGCVMDREEYGQAKKPPEEIFWNICRVAPAVQTRMARAEALDPLQTTADFSYFNRRLVGPRLLRVGDAAGFMDPIFSAGVYLAMRSGRQAARAVLESLETGDDGGVRFATYERELFQAMRYYWVMVEKFYTTPFIELFLEPRPKFGLPDAITAVLAGELEGGWSLEWRRQFFFLLVRIQSLLPLVPRISFQ